MDEKTPQLAVDDASTLAPSGNRSFNEKSSAKEMESSREATRSPSPTPSKHDETTTNLELHKTKSAAEVEAEMQRVMTSGEGIEYPTGVKLHLISLALCLSVFLIALDNTIIATAIPKITDQFKSLDDVGWYGSA